MPGVISTDILFICYGQESGPGEIGITPQTKNPGSQPGFDNFKALFV
jgi:hypothetical protein